jgi:hypothetical protein
MKEQRVAVVIEHPPAYIDSKTDYFNGNTSTPHAIYECNEFLSTAARKALPQAQLIYEYGDKVSRFTVAAVRELPKTEAMDPDTHLVRIFIDAPVEYVIPDH